jgi:hypothetical protein
LIEQDKYVILTSGYLGVKQKGGEHMTFEELIKSLMAQTGTETPDEAIKTLLVLSGLA